MIYRLAAVLCLLPLIALSAPFSKYFESAGDQYITGTHGRAIVISSHSVNTLAPGDKNHTLFEWLGTGPSTLMGQAAANSVTRYFWGSDPAKWRSAVPHFASVRAQNLYARTDVVYYFHGENLEFDVELQPHADASQLRLWTPGVKPWLTTNGDLNLSIDGLTYQLQRPTAYQLLDSGARRAIDCRYMLNDKGEIKFRLGTYDPNRKLIIDPVVDFFTYLSGSGTDQIEALGTDPAGNVIVAGVTTSTDFPGGGAPANSASIFVTKLNSTGTSLAFTTILGSLQQFEPYNLYQILSVTALAVDSDGSIFVAGNAFSSDFPITPGAWQQNSVGGYVTRLDSNGKLVYSTFLGPQGWGLVAQRMQVRSGIAYLAGYVSAPEFFGTSGAFQRSVSGSSDLFAVALAADGSAPIFATAIGGSGQETLSDMTLDASGNMVLVGSSTSQDFPLTQNALPYSPPSGDAAEAILVRLDPTGSKLVSSTWLGTSNVNAVGLAADGGLVIAGASALPSGLISGAAHHTANPAGTTSPGYVVKFPPGSNQPEWTTDLSGTLTGSISFDPVGNLYFSGGTLVSGGALSIYTGYGVSKLSSDGSILLYSSEIPGAFSARPPIAVKGTTVYFAGYTTSTSLPTTPGVLQPQPSPKTSSATFPSQYAPTSGFAGALDLSGFNGGNFFIAPPSIPTGLTWRIGEPAPNPLVVPIATVGQVGQIDVTPSQRLSATLAAPPATGIDVNVNTAQTVAGTFQESVTVQAPAIPNSSVTFPVPITIQPQVSFDLAMSQITFHYRQGQQRLPAQVAITTQFGTENFNFTVVASATWLSGYVNQTYGQSPVTLTVNTGDQPPGTYTGTLTIGLANLVNPTRVIQVTYIVDPPATIQVSTMYLTLHVVRGQPVTPLTVNVTGSVPGVEWQIYPGGYGWLQITQTTTVTPGQIIVSADSTSAPTGYYSVEIAVQGENHQLVYVYLSVDVSSGAPIDVLPASISVEYIRGSQLPYQPPTLTILTPNQGVVQISADQPWITAPLGPWQTPDALTFTFDTTLPEGVYHGNLTVAAGSAKVVVPITWMLYDDPHFVFSPSSFNFQYQIGGPLPASQQLQISTPTILQEYFSASLTDYPSFLSASPQGGTTPATIAVTVNPAGLAAGVHKTNLSIGNAYPYAQPNILIPVTLTVTPNPNAPAATLAKAVDAASYLGGAVAPGEVLVLFGSALGPSTLAQAQPDANGFPTSLDGWTVSFDKFPAPILYASANQTAVMVPFEIAGQATTSITISNGGPASTPLVAPVASVNPGVFTADASGGGLAAAVNVAADGSITPNTQATPVHAGGIVTFYVSGLGATTPIMLDGSLASSPLAKLNGAVEVFLGGVQAQVLYAGPAPGEIAGLTQINIQVPSGVPSGMVPLLVTAGGAASQPGANLAIQ